MKLAVITDLHFTRQQHLQLPKPEFILCCINNGVKLSLGSDSHNLYEVGELHEHLAIIEHIGYLDQLDKIVFTT